MSAAAPSGRPDSFVVRGLPLDRLARILGAVALEHGGTLCVPMHRLEEVGGIMLRTIDHGEGGAELEIVAQATPVR